jgi:hypothetical protein
MDYLEFPRQKIPSSQKNDKWYRATVDSIISRANFNTAWKRGLFDLYDAYNGNINDTVYKYVTNPYNTVNKNYTKFPAKIRNYNIIKPAIDLLMGEKRNRPINFQVVAKNPEAITEYQSYLAELHLQNVQMMFARDLMRYKGVSEEELPQVLEESQVDAYAELNFKERRALMGQEAMDYIWENCDLEENYQLAFFHWLVSGEVYTFRDVNHDEVVHEVVSPVDIDYAQTQNVTFIEDADWVVRRQYMSANEIVDRFYDEEGFDKIIPELENPVENRSSGFFLPFLQQINSNTDLRNNNQAIEVLHVCWKSFSKYGLLTYDDGFGPQTTHVSEDYELTPELGDIDVQWIWVSRVHEAYQIDGKHYVRMRELPMQRNAETNFSVCKLPYNGRIYSNIHSVNISIIQLGLAYQVLYNIVHYRFEISLAKNKDKIMLMEYNAIPRKHGWDEDKFMYYADAMGVAFIDTLGNTEGKSLSSFNQFQVLDMSLGSYLNDSLNLMGAIKAEWEDLLGINRQRKGASNSSDGLGVTQEAIFRSSVITEELFAKFDRFMEKDCQGLLDYSKLAWRNTKKEKYVRSDGSISILDIDPEIYSEADLGLFFRNSNKEHEKLETLKQLAAQFAQQGSQPSTVAEILDASNFAKVKSELRKLEAKAAEMEQQNQQMIQETQTQIQQMQNEALEAERGFRAEENQKDRDHELNLKLIDADIKLAGFDMNSNGIPDASEVEKNAIERIKTISEENFKKRSLDQKDKELELKNKEIETRNEMNKRDNETKLKNPVIGEKK